MRRLNQSLKGETPEERILLYLTDDSSKDILTDEEKKNLEQINFCDDQIRRLMPLRDVVSLLTKKFNFGLSKAYQIVAQTRVVYGTTARISKEYMRSILSDSILEDLQRARSKGDLKAADGLYGKYIKLNNLDKDEESKVPVAPPPAHIHFHFNPELLGVKQEDRVDDRVKEYLAQDTDFEEIKETDGE